MKKYTGEIVKWKERPGYGFIRTDGANPSDIFFHHKYLPMPGYKTVHTGTRVEFELGENHRGPIAITIRITMFADGSIPEEE
mgnify:FL=1